MEKENKFHLALISALDDENDEQRVTIERMRYQIEQNDVAIKQKNTAINHYF